MPTETAFKYLNEVRFMTMSNWSVGAILSDKVLYKDGFKLEPIGNLIIRNREKEILEDDKAYKQVTIKLYGKGVIQRSDELILGKDIGTKNQFRISEGQFIMSKIDARNGAFGIVPAELEGAITTQDFLSYNINTEKILPEFFNLITGTKHFAELCQKASSGTTGRQRVDEKAFLGFRIPVPHLDIQKKIFERYDSAIKRAEALEEDSINQHHQLITWVKSKLGINQTNINRKKGFNIINFKNLKRWDTDFLFGTESQLHSKYDLIEYGQIFKALRNGISARNYSNEGVRFIRVSDVKFNSLDDKDLRYINKYDESDLLKKSTLLITRKGTVGQAFFLKEENQLTASSEIFIISIDESLIMGDYLAELNSFDFIQKQYEEKYTGTIMPSLSQQRLKEVRIPLPPMSVQREIVAEIHKLKSKINSLKEQKSALLIDASKQFESAIFNID
ncbi:restriction endonuclease subunit S [Mucilaginibacter sp. HC2]|uniref:restriction endonuclease subunit S n=1 Tax=Mucilaginibacter inviolabilis TaxID=2714892 RepID=UPI00140ABE12|nr:restriction endonuclease subunit S [Mucilaginibacter inviolabilis]NHA04119.1 restriction endonuclease subunit S [Mucilaginibacter inviolabilis]